MATSKEIELNLEIQSENIKELKVRIKDLETGQASTREIAVTNSTNLTHIRSSQKRIEGIFITLAIAVAGVLVTLVGRSVVATLFF